MWRRIEAGRGKAFSLNFHHYLVDNSKTIQQFIASSEALFGGEV